VLFPALALALAYGARNVLPALGVPLALFKIVIPVLLSFAIIRLSVRVLRAAFPGSELVRAAERTISWVAWLAVVAWITGVLPVVLDELDDIHWKLGGSKVSVRNILEGALSAGFVLMLVLWVSAAIETRLLRGAYGEQLSLRKAAANAVKALLTFVGLLLALTSAGIDLTALSVLGGAVGVGLGFGLQKLAANYVSGFVILAERSLRIGDVVRVDGFEGPHHRHRHALHGDPRAERPRVAGAERVADHAARGELVAGRSEGAVSTQVQVAYGSDVERLQALMPRWWQGPPRAGGSGARRCS
jgi:small-conductance mechanosensitive channel